jgi:hypothetical protein
MVTIDKLFALFVLGLGTWIFMMDFSSILALMIWIGSIVLYYLIVLEFNPLRVFISLFKRVE